MEDTVERVTGLIVVVIFFFCTKILGIRDVVTGNQVRFLLLLGLSKTGDTVVVEVVEGPCAVGSVSIFVVTRFVITGKLDAVTSGK